MKRKKNSYLIGILKVEYNHTHPEIDLLYQYYVITEIFIVNKYNVYFVIASEPKWNYDFLLHKKFRIYSVILFLNFIFLFCDIIVENETRCYEELGCLNITRDWYHLIYRPFNVFPLARQVIDTRFILYTRKNPLQVTIFNILTIIIVTFKIKIGFRKIIWV